MPNMSANKKQSQNKNNKKQNCENNVWFRLKRCFSLLFFGFKSQKQKDHEFFWGVSHFRWNTFWFLLFWFYVIKSQNQQKLEFLLFFSLFLWNSFA
jgi:hypothetical protein